MPDAPASHDDVPVDFRPDIFPVDPRGLPAVKAFVPDGAAGAYGDAVAAAVAQVLLDRRRHPVDDAPNAGNAIPHAEEALAAFFVDAGDHHTVSLL